VSDENKRYAINFTLLIMSIQSSFSSLHDHIQHDTLPCHDSPLGVVTSISRNLTPAQSHSLTHIKQLQFSLTWPSLALQTYIQGNIKFKYTPCLAFM
jgi:hypothetical protein